MHSPPRFYGVLTRLTVLAGLTTVAAQPNPEEQQAKADGTDAIPLETTLRPLSSRQASDNDLGCVPLEQRFRGCFLDLVIHTAPGIF